MSGTISQKIKSETTEGILEKEILTHTNHNYTGSDDKMKRTKRRLLWWLISISIVILGLLVFIISLS
jgi:hypothetical protein